MKLGYINYLNCYPFYHHMMTKSPLDGVQVVPAYPSALNAMMREGALDMRPVSSAAYADVRDALILPGFCLSSIGYVRSVVLVSRVPIEELDGRTLGLSSASQTSVVLLKMLLERHYGVRPAYVPSPPRPSLSQIDAALVIGNEAMMHEAEPIPIPTTWATCGCAGPGTRWSSPCSLSARPAARTMRADIERVVQSYRNSLACLETERSALIDAARAKYPDVAYDIDTYYRLLRFEFTDELKSALAYYYAQAGEMGLIPGVGEIRYYGEGAVNTNNNHLERKILAGDRIDRSDALALFSYDLAELGLLSNARRRMVHPTDEVGFIVDRIVNYTNVCTAACAFCAYHARAGLIEPYRMTIDEVLGKVDELARAGGTQVMLQGGSIPSSDWTVPRHAPRRKGALSLDVPAQLLARETVHLARRHGIPVAEVIAALKDAGSIPCPAPPTCWWTACAGWSARTR